MMKSQLNKAAELQDEALDATHGGTDPLHLLAQVNHLQSQSASTKTVSPTTKKGIIAVLIG